MVILDKIFIERALVGSDIKPNKDKTQTVTDCPRLFFYILFIYR